MPSVVFDMDGVIYRGTDAMPHAVECVNSLINHDARVGFLTNNSGRSRTDYVRILAGHGINAVENMIMTSGLATARYLVADGAQNERAFVIGGAGLVETLNSHGFITDIEDEGDPCGLVIIGWDKQFTFRKIVRAQLEILENNARLIATNADPMYPAQGDKLLPGAGTMVAAVETASGAKAEIIGKPNTISLEYLLTDLGMADDESPDSVWVIGDRLDADIACGNAYGAHTVCVLTGIAGRDQAESASGNMRPDFIIDSLAQLPALIFQNSAAANLSS